MKRSISAFLFGVLFAASSFAADIPKEGVLPANFLKGPTMAEKKKGSSVQITCDLDEEALEKGVIVVRFTADNIQDSRRIGINGISAACTFNDFLKK
ncbi:MAG: hypothetical protein K8I29_01820 [Alphaproteobacteria bacterium]|uniref:Uncharacterized protein n=1 Tax=Candidatus Nitrobium versatile TaxID=2884831 RepID=A0A953M0A7_9BACT|nr:hypothetical protein [Candidatus Nitrobium versatile]